MGEQIKIKQIYIHQGWTNDGWATVGEVTFSGDNKFCVTVTLNDVDTAQLILLCKGYLSRALTVKNADISNSLQAFAQQALQDKKAQQEVISVEKE